MEISVIAAISQNYAIGKNNSLPWRLSNDMKWFKNLTSGNAIIMGRKTFDSIGKILPDRLNIVLTKHSNVDRPQKKDLLIAHSLSDALSLAHKYSKVFIIGGQQVFNEGINYASKLYITHVDTKVDEADAFFPQINSDIWSLTYKEDYKADNKNDHNHSFCIYIRQR